MAETGFAYLRNMLTKVEKNTFSRIYGDTDCRLNLSVFLLSAV